MYFYGSSQRPSGAGPFWTLRPSFDQTWLKTTRQCYLPVLLFKHLGQVVLRSNFLIIFLCISIIQTEDPWGGSIFKPGGHNFNKLHLDYLAMLHTKFQASEPSSSGKEDFKYTLFLRPCCRATLDLRVIIRINLVEVHHKGVCEPLQWQLHGSCAACIIVVVSSFLFIIDLLSVKIYFI